MLACEALSSPDSLIPFPSLAPSSALLMNQSATAAQKEENYASYDGNPEEGDEFVPDDSLLSSGGVTALTLCVLSVALIALSVAQGQDTTRVGSGCTSANCKTFTPPKQCVQLQKNTHTSAAHDNTTGKCRCGVPVSKAALQQGLAGGCGLAA